MQDRITRASDPARCPLCGASNACAVARAGAAAAETAEPCWCVGRRFPAALVALARERDGGEACICRRCLEAASAPALTSADER